MSYVTDELVRQRNAMRCERNTWRALAWQWIGLTVASWAFWGVIFYLHCKVG